MESRSGSRLGIGIWGALFLLVVTPPLSAADIEGDYLCLSCLDEASAKLLAIANMEPDLTAHREEYCEPAGDEGEVELKPESLPSECRGLVKHATYVNPETREVYAFEVEWGGVSMDSITAIPRSLPESEYSRHQNNMEALEQHRNMLVEVGESVSESIATGQLGTSRTAARSDAWSSDETPSSCDSNSDTILAFLADPERLQQFREELGRQFLDAYQSAEQGERGRVSFQGHGWRSGVILDRLAGEYKMELTGVRNAPHLSVEFDLVEGHEGVELPARPDRLVVEYALSTDEDGKRMVEFSILPRFSRVQGYDSYLNDDGIGFDRMSSCERYQVARMLLNHEVFVGDDKIDAADLYLGSEEKGSGEGCYTRRSAIVKAGGEMIARQRIRLVTECRD
ncbi:hypothetical protein VCB98_13160 [Gammaproteobacteria bacterium AB-CW1]|uniref:Uncharacterized protein n=1 Tax=Natronospira elongata TaxID=3110268 RepID=A0AAP6JJJ5_9GAMM|nr:hypothetical protein [Gammaproteobacteria bacterium AB-CW1]